MNYIRANFSISYDEVMDLYTDTWIEVRKIILSDRATDDKWKALIFRIGWRQAYRRVTRHPEHISISNGGDEDEETFNRGLFEAEKAAQSADAKSVYEDPELQAVLGAELSYIPDPCNKIPVSYTHLSYVSSMYERYFFNRRLPFSTSLLSLIHI